MFKNLLDLGPLFGAVMVGIAIVLAVVITRSGPVTAGKKWLAVGAFVVFAALAAFPPYFVSGAMKNVGWSDFWNISANFNGNNSTTYLLANIGAFVVAGVLGSAFGLSRLQNVIVAVLVASLPEVYQAIANTGVADAADIALRLVAFLVGYELARLVRPHTKTAATK